MPQKRNQNPRLLAALDLLSWHRSARIKYQGRHSFLNRSDYALYRFLVSAVIRHKLKYQYIVCELSGRPLQKIDPEALICMMLGLAQLDAATRVQEYAAVNETVELMTKLDKPYLKGFVNANLRAFIRNKQEILNKCEQQPLDIFSSHPKWMIKRWLNQYGDETTRQICMSDNAIPRLQIVINPKFPENAVLSDLAVQGIEYSAAQKGSFTIVNPSGVFDSEVSESGSFLVQDASSSALIEMMEHLPKNTVLDACAAPGGKLFHLEWRYGSEIELLVGSDNSKSRLHRLLENKKRFGSRGHILAMDIKNPSLNVQFDLVMIDAPCSGTGTIQKHPEIKWNRRENDFINNQKNQLTILDSACQMVKSGGFLLYVTCSLEKEENQLVVDQFLYKNQDSYSLYSFQNIVKECDYLTKEGCYLSVPNNQRMGLFAALMQKK